MTPPMETPCGGPAPGRPTFLFDLDGTRVDSVDPHILAWREALERAGIERSVWRIHRRIGMSGSLLLNALLRETGQDVTSAVPVITRDLVNTPSPTPTCSWRVGEASGTC